jgi:galactose mutarotase-like enzyme
MANALDDAYRLHDGSADRSFLLTGADGDLERSVRIDVGDGFRFAQAYAPRGAAFAAFEPMTAPINALVSGEHPQVEPGSSFTATFSIAVPAADPQPIATPGNPSRAEPDAPPSPDGDPPV